MSQQKKQAFLDVIDALKSTKLYAHINFNTSLMISIKDQFYAHSGTLSNMYSKVILTKKQLEDILKMLNGIPGSNHTAHSLDSSTSECSEDTLQVAQRQQLPSESMLFINFNDNHSASVLDNPDTERSKSAKLRRHKSLLEIKREKWDEERLQAPNSDIWYNKFDSLSKLHGQKILNHQNSSLSKSAFNIHALDAHPFVHFAHMHNESPYDGMHEKQSLSSSAFNVRPFDCKIGSYPSTPTLVHGELESSLNSSNFRRYSRCNNQENVEKRLKQLDYQNYLRLQLAEKEIQKKLEAQKQAEEENAQERRLAIQQEKLRQEFEADQQRARDRAKGRVSLTSNQVQEKNTEESDKVRENVTILREKSAKSLENNDQNETTASQEEKNLLEQWLEAANQTKNVGKRLSLQSEIRKPKWTETSQSARPTKLVNIINNPPNPNKKDSGKLPRINIAKVNSSIGQRKNWKL